MQNEILQNDSHPDDLIEKILCQTKFVQPVKEEFL